MKHDPNGNLLLEPFRNIKRSAHEEQSAAAVPQVYKRIRLLHRTHLRGGKTSDNHFGTKPWAASSARSNKSIAPGLFWCRSNLNDTNAFRKLIVGNISKGSVHQVDKCILVTYKTHLRVGKSSDTHFGTKLWASSSARSTKWIAPGHILMP